MIYLVNNDGIEIVLKENIHDIYLNENHIFDKPILKEKVTNPYLSINALELVCKDYILELVEALKLLHDYLNDELGILIVDDDMNRIIL
jgi:hypothetical protein